MCRNNIPQSVLAVARYPLITFFLVALIFGISLPICRGQEKETAVTDRAEEPASFKYPVPEKNDDAITFDFSYMGGIFNNMRGGLRTHDATRYMGEFDAKVTADTEKLGLWKNGTFSALGSNYHGGSMTDYWITNKIEFSHNSIVGDYGAVSKFDFPNLTQLMEFWYQHDFFEKSASLRVGRLDANTEFDLAEIKSGYINSMSMLSPNVLIPTAPYTSTGVIGILQVVPDRLTFKYGLFDADSDKDQYGFFYSGMRTHVYQLDLKYDLFGTLPAHHFFGFWHDNIDRDNDDDMLGRAVIRHGASGFYTTISQMLSRKNPHDKTDMRGLSWYGSYSVADNKTVDVGNYFATGLVEQGPFESRKDDSLGAAFYYMQFSPFFGAPHGKEIVSELYYRVQLNERTALTPDLQFLSHPSGTYKDAFVCGLVFESAF